MSHNIIFTKCCYQAEKKAKEEKIKKDEAEQKAKKEREVAEKAKKEKEEVLI